MVLAVSEMKCNYWNHHLPLPCNAFLLIPSFKMEGTELNTNVFKFFVGQGSRCGSVVIWDHEASKAPGSADKIRAGQRGNLGSCGPAPWSMVSPISACQQQVQLLESHGTALWFSTLPVRCQVLFMGDYGLQRREITQEWIFPLSLVSCSVSSCYLLVRLEGSLFLFFFLYEFGVALHWKPASPCFWPTPLVRLVLPHHDLFL